MNFKLLLLSILLVFNLSISLCWSENAVDETVIQKKLNLKTDSLDQLNLDKPSSDKLNVSDPSLKNISDKLSSTDELPLKKVKERETDEIKEHLSDSKQQLTDEITNGLNGNNKNLKHKTTDTKKDDKKHKDKLDDRPDSRSEESTKADDLPSFDEWKKKVVEEEPNNQQSAATINSSNKKMFQNSIKGNKLRIRNYASGECGAKVINSNKEAQGNYKILSESQDEYMLNPCNSKIWFIIELCEAIKLSSIEVANYELFSSTFRDFLIYGSGHYPTRDWQLIGNFTANDVKQVQVFSFAGETEFRKFIKIEVLSHHGSEHFCPFSLVRMFGTSMTDEFDALDGNDMKMQLDDTEVFETIQPNENRTEAKFLSEKSVVYKILVKVAEFFYKNKPERDRKETKEENFAKFLRDRDTLDAIIEQSVMSMLPALKSKLKVCSNLEMAKSRKQLNRRIKFCNYLRTLISPTTFDLLMKEMNKESNLQFKCLINLNSTDLSRANKSNLTDDNDQELVLTDLKSKKIESLVLDTKLNSNNLNDEIQLKSNDFFPVTDSIKITSPNSQTLLLPTPTITIDEEKHSSIDLEMQLKKKIDDQTKQSSAKSVEFEDNTQSDQVNDEKKPIESSSVVDKPYFENTIDPNDQLDKSPPIEKQSPDSPLSSSKLLHPPADDELPNGTPISGSSSKETIFIRMINKIKTLELNLSLSSQYLEELSQRYRRQMDEMQKNFNQTVFKLNETSKNAAEKDNRQQLLLDKLGSKISELEEKLDRKSVV